MRAGQPSRTAAHNALFRALEARRPAHRRIADDTFALRFLPPEYRLLAEVARVPPIRRAIETVIDRLWPCARTGVVVRTGLLDETITRELPEVEQVLVLGAGFDTRACRLPAMGNARVFEVDHPSTQAVKQQVLTRTLGAVPPHLGLVPVVFGQDDPRHQLELSGFTTGMPTLALWEGVTNYLTPEAVDATFALLAEVLAPGSPILFTYVHRGMLDGTARFDGATTTMKAVGRVGEPFTFGFDPGEVPAYLAERGLTLEWDVSVEEAAARSYPGRAPNAPAYYHVVAARRS